MHSSADAETFRLRGGIITLSVSLVEILAEEYGGINSLSVKYYTTFRGRELQKTPPLGGGKESCLLGVYGGKG